MKEILIQFLAHDTLTFGSIFPCRWTLQISFMTNFDVSLDLETNLLSEPSSLIGLLFFTPYVLNCKCTVSLIIFDAYQTFLA